MLCPSCNHVASSFLRSVFTLQGVSFAKAKKSYLRCQHCGALLRVVGFRKEVWFMALAEAMVFFTFWLFFLRSLIASVGVAATLVYWVVFVIVMVSLYLFGLWKYALAVKVDEGDGSEGKPAT